MYERKCHCRFDQGLRVHCLPLHGILHRETVFDHFAQMETESRRKQGAFCFSAGLWRPSWPEILNEDPQDSFYQDEVIVISLMILQRQQRLLTAKV